LQRIAFTAASVSLAQTTTGLHEVSKRREGHEECFVLKNLVFFGCFVSS